ncbi:LysE family translocator [Corynebacterium sp.]|uniref:LysE family translocator n=1 Tax=Corynebacterium sp. TaxID=1720 RepID=UPI002649A90B|nr:LysE family translocator [Corynebacterium sp.]MDN6137613.1 LysE family translocator [Corynebacterium sp.]MDN6737835.1 LysE family translocator [Corynebacterium sp.]
MRNISIPYAIKEKISDGLVAGSSVLVGLNLAGTDPGVDWAYIIASGISGKPQMRWAVGGVLGGHVTATLIVAAGVAVIMITSDTAMLVLTLTGAAYMVWLGIQTLRQAPSAQMKMNVAPASGTRLFVKGMGINLLNPKTYLFFLALLPQFTARQPHYRLARRF